MRALFNVGIKSVGVVLRHRAERRLHRHVEPVGVISDGLNVFIDSGVYIRAPRRARVGGFASCFCNRIIQINYN